MCWRRGRVRVQVKQLTEDGPPQYDIQFLLRVANPESSRQMGGEGRTVATGSQPPEHLGRFIVQAVPYIEVTVIANRLIPAQDEGQPRRHYHARQEKHEHGTPKATILNQLSTPPQTVKLDGWSGASPLVSGRDPPARGSLSTCSNDLVPATSVPT